MELADVLDSKSCGSDTVPVRPRSPAPMRDPYFTYVKYGFFVFYLYFVIQSAIIYVYCCLNFTMERMVTDMNILVIGCGKVGSNLCNMLSEQGHDISVVSENAGDFSELSPDFNGYTTVGVVIDQDVLKRAGIENCDALAAVTSDDNINLMVVQMAKEFFHVPRTYARVNDPKKHDVFTKMGIVTICPTNMTVATLSSALSGQDTSGSISLGSHSLVMTRVDIEKRMVGKRLSDLQFEGNETIVAVEHEDTTIENVFLTNYELVRGDKLICVKFAD